MDDMITKSGLYKLSIDLLYDICGSILYAAGIYTFALNANFAPAGISGLSIIINHFTHWPVGTVALLLNIPIILVCIRVLGKNFFLKSIKSMIVVTVFLDVIFPFFPMYQGSQLLASLFSGALTGIGLALIYMRESSTGGTDFVIMSVRKKAPHLSIGQITLFVDGAVILLGGIVFGQVDAVLYGILSTAICMITVDKIMEGFSTGKIATVISENGLNIAQAISDKTGRGATLLKGVGAFTGNEKQVVICACSNTEVMKIKRTVYHVDESALVMVSEYNEAFGEGFKDPKSDE